VDYRQRCPPRRYSPDGPEARIEPLDNGIRQKKKKRRNNIAISRKPKSGITRIYAILESLADAKRARAPLEFLEWTFFFSSHDKPVLTRARSNMLPGFSILRSLSFQCGTPRGEISQVLARIHRSASG